MTEPPLLITFVPGSTVYRQPDLAPGLRVLRNGPPGTFVDLPNGLRVSLPTDQIVLVEQNQGSASVGFGGMRASGVTEGRLIFVRVRELHPEEALSPDRSSTMILEPAWVASVRQDGQRVWPPRDIA